MQRGELIVVTDGEVQIQLSATPIKLEVGFSDDGEIITPCDPHFHDHLDFEINQSLLTIKWRVSGLREIEWRAWFYWKDISDDPD